MESILEIRCGLNDEGEIAIEAKLDGTAGKLMTCLDQAAVHIIKSIVEDERPADRQMIRERYCARLACSLLQQGIYPKEKGERRPFATLPDDAEMVVSHEGRPQGLPEARAEVRKPHAAQGGLGSRTAGTAPQARTQHPKGDGRA